MKQQKQRKECKCSCHKKPKDHKGIGCCNYVNEPKANPPQTDSCDIPKECWAAEYTEDERIDAIRTEIDKVRREEKKRIGKEFSKWLNDSFWADTNEDIADAIERITGEKRNLANPKNKCKHRFYDVPLRPPGEDGRIYVKRCCKCSIGKYI